MASTRAKAAIAATAAAVVGGALLFATAPATSLVELRPAAEHGRSHLTDLFLGPRVTCSAGARGSSCAQPANGSRTPIREKRTVPPFGCTS